MTTKKTGTLGGTTTDETDPPLTTMLTFDNNATTSGWRLSKTANKPRWIQDKEGNIICFPVMLMDFDRANTVQQPLGGMSIRDPTTIGNRAAVRANVTTTPWADAAAMALDVNAKTCLWDPIALSWRGMPYCYYKRQVSAVNTANVVSITYLTGGNLHSNLAIHFACSAGTATLGLEVSSDGTNYLVLEAVAAAAAGVLNFGPTTVAATLGLSPLAFPWIRITVGAAGAGNTTTLTVAMK